MQYRAFGRTGLQVSTLGFGCMRLPCVGENRGKIDIPLATEMLRGAIDQGVNYVDTAYPYHDGASEPFVAQALKNGYRAKVHLATKLPCWRVNSRADMDRLLDEQLARLGTDTIDCYLMHNLDRDNWPRVKQYDYAGFLTKALSDGRIRFAGFSFHDRFELFEEILGAYDWAFCQIQYNYLDEHEQAGRKGLELAAARGMGVVVMEPLRGGALAGKIPGEVRARFDAFPVKRSPADWALRWVWDHDGVSTALSGMSAPEQVTENIQTACAAGRLAPEEKALLKEAQSLFARRVKVPCTGCEYCMPCPNGVNIPLNFSAYNEYSMLGVSTAYQLSEESARAGHCIQCGACVQHCPQHIAIPDRLQEVSRQFD